MSKKYELFFIGLLVFLSRLPFLTAGYGHEEDSWGIALAAQNTFVTGVYEVSRMPGHPVQELILSALWGTGYFVYNLFSALFSVIAVVYFAKALRLLSFRHYRIASLAFAFVPLVFIAGTYTADYMWTQAFVMMSFYFLLRKKYTACGIFLGLAIGCRVTAGAMLIPWAIIAYDKANRQSIYTVFKFAAISIITGAIYYIPVLMVYGTNLLLYYDGLPYPPAAKVIYKGTFGVWGVAGMLALLLALVFFIRNKMKYINAEYNQPLLKKHLLAWISVILIYTLAYLRLPQKSAYMLPVIPFIILILSVFLSKQQFILVSLLMILSPFFFGINLTDKIRGSEYSSLAIKTRISGQEIFFDPLTGPVLADWTKRKQKMKYTDQFIEKTDSISEKTVIIAGWWHNEIHTKLTARQKNENVIIKDYINEDDIRSYLKRGYRIFYLPEQDSINDGIFRINITNKAAYPFPTGTSN